MFTCPRHPAVFALCPDAHKHAREWATLYYDSPECGAAFASWLARSPEFVQMFAYLYGYKSLVNLFERRVQ